MVDPRRPWSVTQDGVAPHGLYGPLRQQWSVWNKLTGEVDLTTENLAEAITRRNVLNRGETTESREVS